MSIDISNRNVQTCGIYVRSADCNISWAVGRYSDRTILKLGFSSPQLENRGLF